MDITKGTLLKSKLKSFAEYQSKFIKHYNNSENKIKATSELNLIKKGLNILSYPADGIFKKLDLLEKILDSEIKCISKNEIKKTNSEGGRNLQKGKQKLTELKFELVNSINKYIDNGTLNSNPQKAYNNWIDIMAKFYQILQQEEYREKVRDILDSIYYEGVKREKDLIFGVVLSSILENIYMQGFPQELQYVKEQEAAKLLSMSAAVGNPVFKKNKWEAPEGFYKRATEIKQDNPNFGQEGLYTQLMDEFFCDKSIENEKPSFSTVRRRLKSKEII